MGEMVRAKRTVGSRGDAVNELGGRMARFQLVRADDELPLLDGPVHGRVLGKPSDDMWRADVRHGAPPFKSARLSPVWAVY